MGRRLSRLLAALPALLLLAAPVAAADLCAGLQLPPGIDLLCEPERPAAAGDPVVVRPLDDSGFGTLSRLRVARLEREGPDALAWTDPEAWLERQLVLDTSGLAKSARDLVEDPDNPLGGDTLRDATEMLVGAVDRMGRMALAACGDPIADDGRSELSCKFGGGPLAFYLNLRLVADGDDRYALMYQTMSERRLRHLEAIANGFRPAG
ncbi:MAG TPA: hypothetical protein VFG43_13455 [Geminicoccaceae bacterium]|nr:hypothetical protein [Geminicoccaceae bacterium]